MLHAQKFKYLAKNFTVLYVEDDDDLRKSFLGYLSKFFKRVDFAIDGEEGFHKYQLNKYDLVITDVSMPKLNGIDMAKKIKTLNPNQEIVIASAFSDFDTLSEAIKLGIDGYLLKPINYDQMSEILYKVVHKINEFKQNDLYKEHLNELIEIKSHEIEDLNKEKIENYKLTLYALVDLIEKRDTYTGGHSNRVALYSDLIAKQMGINEQDCGTIYKAAMLHDIGKIAIPDSVLLKPGSLNDLEYQLIKEHVSIGYEILKKVPMFKQEAKIVQSHHERIDGSGYPNGLKADEIPLFSMILAVADTFDAMTTNRIYKARKTLKEALEEIDNLKGKLFLEDVVDAAVVALKDIELHEQINQLPQTHLEKARFSYFYIDQLTKVYNNNYLDVVLTQNKYDYQYDNLYLIFLHNFGEYNKAHGWNEGSNLLHKVAQQLTSFYPDTLIFRIHGDDFVIVASKSIDLNLTNKFFETENIDFATQAENIAEKKLFSLQLLEFFIDKETK